MHQAACVCRVRVERFGWLSFTLLLNGCRSHIIAYRSHIIAYRSHIIAYRSHIIAYRSHIWCIRTHIWPMDNFVLEAYKLLSHNIHMNTRIPFIYDYTVRTNEYIWLSYNIPFILFALYVRIPHTHIPFDIRLSRSHIFIPRTLAYRSIYDHNIHTVHILFVHMNTSHIHTFISLHTSHTVHTLAPTTE